MSRVITSVREVWQEWENGLLGGPAVKWLEDTFGARWRRTAAERKHFSRRKKIINYIMKIAEERGISGSEAANELDELREQNGLTLNSLLTKFDA